MRVFKIIARGRTSWELITYPGAKNHNRISKKRIYTSLEDFNKYCICPDNPENGTLFRYNDIYGNQECYEKVNGEWIRIYPKLGKEYTADIAVASRVG